MFRGALSAVHPLSERISQMMVMAVLLFLLLSFVTLFTAIVPVLVVHKIAKQFSITSIWYYVGCGALTGLALLRQALNFARYSAPSGAAGGLVYWVVTGRFVKRAQT